MKTGVSKREGGKKLLHNVSFRENLDSKPKYAALLFLCFLVLLTAMPSGAWAATLNVSISPGSPNYGGSVTSNPSGIDCPSGSCSVTNNGLGSTTYTLSEAPNACYNFANWSGSCTGIGACSVSVGGFLSGTTYNVTANFTIKQFTATAQATGNGTGSVASNTGGINYNYPANNTGTTSAINCGTNVVLTANAGTGSTAAWNDCVSAGGTTGGTATAATCTFSSLTATKTITATFTLNQYTVTPSAGPNGSISPSTPQTVDYNQTTSFTVTPSTGYHISSVGGTCGGSLVGNIYTTNAVTANCTVAANFAINTYTVTPSAGANGSISPSTPQTVSYNATTSFTVTPIANYHIASVTGCGGSLAGNTYTTGPITADCTVAASFAINTYTVTPSAGANGSINPSTPQTVNYNQTTMFTVTPNTGYHIASVNGTCGGSLVGNNYTTNTITADCTVAASFAVNTYTVTPSSGSVGTISPSTPQTVNYNQTTQFTVTPNAGYHIASVGGTCGGALVGNTYTTNAVTANCTVAASFAINTYTVTPSAGANGTINPSTPQTVSYNQTTSFTVTPSAGYHAVMSGTCGGSLVGNTYTTNAITADCTVVASFTINTYTVSPSAGSGGTINPSTPQTVNYNQTTSFTVTPNAGYHTTSVNGTCGGSLVGNTFTTNTVTANCTVVASFVANTYTVTPSAGSGGTISPSAPQTVNYSATPSFTVTPNTGYHITSVNGTCGGSLVGNTYTTNAITADCTVVASFAINIYTVTPSAGSGGTINPSTPQTVNYNQTTSFTVTPSAGYHIASVGGTCGGSLVSNTYTTNAVTANCTVSASFAINTYTVTPSAGSGGTINPSTPQTVNYNQTTSFTVTPNMGYHITSVNGTCGGSLGGNTYTTNAVTADCTVVASFAIDTHTVTASAGANGSISPSGAVSVNHGATQSFTVTPNANYHVADVLADGSSAGAVTSYQFINVTADHTISASFAANVTTHTVTASAGSGGSISPSGAVSVNNGASQAFSITANSGYHIASVLVDGSSVGAVSSYTFTNVTTDHTISATFAADAVPNVSAGTHSNYTVNLGDGVSVTFTQITGPCSVSKTTSGLPGAAPSGYRFAGNLYDISHTGCSMSGPITVTFPYNESSISGSEADLQLFHWESGAWRNVTTSRDAVNNTITGTTTSLSPFGAGYPYSGGNYSTGANSYMIALLAFIAISTGLFFLRRTQRPRNI